VPLPDLVAVLSSFGFSQMCRRAFLSCVVTAFHLASGACVDRRARTGWAFADQMTTHGTHQQPPGHCPVNQVVNVIRQMWDVAVAGQMKRAQGGLLSCRIPWEVELYCWSGMVV